MNQSQWLFDQPYGLHSLIEPALPPKNRSAFPAPVITVPRVMGKNQETRNQTLKTDPRRI